MFWVFKDFMKSFVFTYFCPYNLNKKITRTTLYKIFRMSFTDFNLKIKIST